MVSTKQIGKAFKLMKVAGAYWQEIHQTQCSQEFMVQLGQQKRS